MQCVFCNNILPPSPYTDWEHVFKDLEDPTNIGYVDRFRDLLKYLAGINIWVSLGHRI